MSDQVATENPVVGVQPDAPVSGEAAAPGVTMPGAEATAPATPDSNAGSVGTLGMASGNTEEAATWNAIDKTATASIVDAKTAPVNNSGGIKNRFMGMLGLGGGGAKPSGLMPEPGAAAPLGAPTPDHLTPNDNGTLGTPGMDRVTAEAAAKVEEPAAVDAPAAVEAPATDPTTASATETSTLGTPDAPAPVEATPEVTTPEAVGAEAPSAEVTTEEKPADEPPAAPEAGGAPTWQQAEEHPVMAQPATPEAVPAPEVAGTTSQPVSEYQPAPMDMAQPPTATAEPGVSEAPSTFPPASEAVAAAMPTFPSPAAGGLDLETTPTLNPTATKVINDAAVSAWNAPIKPEATTAPTGDVMEQAASVVTGAEATGGALPPPPENTADQMGGTVEPPTAEFPAPAAELPTSTNPVEAPADGSTDGSGVPPVPAPAV